MLYPFRTCKNCKLTCTLFSMCKYRERNPGSPIDRLYKIKNSNTKPFMTKLRNILSAQWCRSHLYLYMTTTRNARDQEAQLWPRSAKEITNYHGRIHHSLLFSYQHHGHMDLIKHVTSIREMVTRWNITLIFSQPYRCAYWMHQPKVKSWYQASSTQTHKDNNRSVAKKKNRKVPTKEHEAGVHRSSWGMRPAANPVLQPEVQLQQCSWD
jgi:hypothetical protein